MAIKMVQFIPRYVAEAIEGYPDRALISVYSIKDTIPVHKAGWYEILQLRFNDVDALNPERPELELFNHDHAKMIIGKILNWNEKDEIERLIVHCHAGVSRSAAIAKFAADMLRLDNFNHKYPLYNKLVYRVLMNEYMDQSDPINRKYYV